MMDVRRGFRFGYWDACLTAQKLKLGKGGEVTHDTFIEAVENIYQLLGPSMPNPERGAWEGAKAEKDKLGVRVKKLDARIKEEEKSMDPDDRAWKPEMKKARELWKLYDDFLASLINIGHKYALIPWLGRVEQPEGIGPSSVTE